MKFTEAIKTCYSKSFTCSGRASRSEYWYFGLFLYLVLLLFYAIVAFLIFITRDQYGRPNDYLVAIGKILFLMFFLMSLPAIFCCHIRRLHDIGKSGWYYLWVLIPYVGGLIFLYWAVEKGEEKDNEYGPNPLAKKQCYEDGTKLMRDQESVKGESVYTPRKTALKEDIVRPTQHTSSASTNLPPELPKTRATPPSIPATSYYVAIDGKQVGPMFIQQVMNLIMEGKITPNTLIWKEGLPDWALAETFQELNTSFNENKI